MPPKIDMLQQLKQRRGVVEAKLKLFSEYIATDKDKIEAGELKLRVSKAEELWQAYDKIQTDIDLLLTEPDLANRKAFESNFFRAIADAQHILQDLPLGQPQQEKAQTAEKTNQKVKLPTLQLPYFTGKFDEWLPFFEVFVSLIHNNQELSNVEKFHYLRSALRGDAQQCIESLHLTNGNYPIAWDLLHKTYHNNRLIIQSHIKGLFEVQKLDRESTGAIKELIDTVHKHVEALRAMGQSTETWDPMLVYLVTSKLDTTTRKAWELNTDPKKLPKFDELCEFLRQRHQMLEAVSSATGGSSKAYRATNKHSSLRQSTNTCHVSTTPETECRLCHGGHKLFQCISFLGMPVPARIEKVKQLGLCFNCLKADHISQACKSGTCKVCKGHHNTLLHLKSPNTHHDVLHSTQELSNTSPNSLSVNAQPFNFAPPQTLASTTKDPSKQQSGTPASHVMLSTAIILVYDAQSRPHYCRALLDSASQSSFVTSQLAQVLQLREFSGSSSVNGIGTISTSSLRETEVTIQSRITPYRKRVHCLILPRITQAIPTIRADSATWNLPVTLHLADPNFNCTQEIDMLLGADIFFEVLAREQFRPKCGYPTIQNTAFGWIIAGKIDPLSQSTSSKTLCCCCTATDTLQNQLEAFWHLEEPSTTEESTPEEEYCEEFFKATTTRNSDGRYVVRLPLKANPNELGASKEIAARRFFKTERAFQRNEAQYQAYLDFMREYEALNHMSLVPNDEHCSPEYYLPHHGVYRQDSLTTKLRVVYDASAKTSSGLSLNDILYVGPTVQNDLFSILLNFRQYRYAIVADIEKMYRQVLVHEHDASLQKILWRESPTSILQTYQLQTVTYGTSCAPYLATRALLQLVRDEGHRFPLAARAAERDFYVDDILTGSNTWTEARELCIQLSALLQQGGFTLHKWCSNDPSLLPSRDSEDDGNNPHKVIGADGQDIRTLGLRWNPTQDTFVITAGPIQMLHPATKRSVLSQISKIFDPLGLVNPVIVKAKLLMQQLWSQGCDWDEPIPAELYESWLHLCDELTKIQMIRIPRRVTNDISGSKIVLHGFCDASLNAYGACIYMVSDSKSELLTAKSRVAPLKAQTLPRLELCAAVLLSRLIAKVQSSLSLPTIDITLWSDSLIVLSWISSPPTKWVTFVCNRVSEIQRLTHNCKWRHVKGKDNPADIVSRGAAPEALSASTLWWHGPAWLSGDPSDYQTDEDALSPPPVLEQRTCAVVVHIEPQTCLPLKQYSSWTRLLRVTAFILRFIHNIRYPHDKHFGEFSIEEISRAKLMIIRQVQREVYSHDIDSLQRNQTVSNNSTLRTLSPFLDNGIIRVGGRIVNAGLPYQSMHQALLPKHHVSTLIAAHEHAALGHAGPQLLLTHLRQEFWPIAGRRLVNTVTRNCVTCFKHRPTAAKQQMGNLPPVRVQPARPFINVGIDFCGPIQIRFSRKRGAPLVKAYIALFVCLASKAVHLELVGDMSTDAFIAALRRFMARRGKCANIYSDNGTNFTGAARHLREVQTMVQSATSDTKLQHFLQESMMKWHFIPPYAPEFGGLWEASVKLAKHHLKRMLGEAHLTFEEAYTVITQVEAFLNSRPITPLSADPNDLEPLTPGHFLIGHPLTAIIDPDLQPLPLNRLSRFQLLQRLQQQFWTRWSSEYLTSLQHRARQFKASANLQVGDLVVLKEEHVPPQHWALGRVTETHPGTDGLVRVVSVKTVKGVVRRPISKVCPLPKTEDN